MHRNRRWRVDGSSAGVALVLTIGLWGVIVEQHGDQWHGGGAPTMWAEETTDVPSSEKKNEASDEGTSEKAHKHKPNRLLKEKSPYLRQHAYNPVDWFPWGEEAFKKAVAENRPIFLSIGYSTCHWCHVMERESFEDEEIAAYLNEHFVCIKVDREERPDIDGIYMDAVVALRRSGGWPLSVFMTPQAQPFFGGTYFPPRDHPQRGSGFLSICKKVTEVWRDQRVELEKQAQRLTDHVRRESQRIRALAPLQDGVFDKAYSQLSSAFDSRHGGFKGSPHYPKFPRSSTMDFLLRYAKRPTTSKETAETAQSMVFTTLDHMIRGGIRDHLAGGFHRYSTDREWLIPHFEKMLYDQALITRTLVDAARASGNEAYVAIARETMDYVLERMTGPDGEIYCAEDADTNDVEGLTYVWQRDEVMEVLGAERGPAFVEYYGISAEGNFEEAGHGSNVLHVKTAESLDEIAKRNGQTPAALEEQFAESRRRLLAIRDKRPQPLRDDKVLTGWNGMAISALSQLYQVAGEAKYLNAARRSAIFVLERMEKDGQLFRRYREGEVAIGAFLNDYVFFIEGLLDLYETDFDRRWLATAIRLSETLIGFFWDAQTGGFFSHGSHQEELIARQKEFYDGAIPSGNSTAFMVLLRLLEFTGREDLTALVDQMEKVASGVLSGGGGAGAGSYPALLCAANYRRLGAHELVVVGVRTDGVTQAMLRELHQRFLPTKILLFAESATEASELGKLVPLAAGKLAIGGKTTAYVCRDGVCRLPARDLETLKNQLP